MSSALAAAAAPAVAQAPDRSAGAFGALVGNHIEFSYGGGPVSMRSSFAPDGTYRLTGGGSTVTGDWVADDRVLCWIQREPRVPQSQGVRCEAHETEGRTVGDTWTQVDRDRETTTVTLRAGPSQALTCRRLRPD